MKATFYNLDEDKRRRVETAAIEEFGVYGYERGSTDRIIRKSGISKGGLYEYIESKEDLFLHVVRKGYGALYDHIAVELRKSDAQHGDILECFRLAAEAALHFYLDNPPVVRLIASLANLADPDVKSRTEQLFQETFQAMFGQVLSDNLAFDRERVLDLLKWLLVKTRNDFISEMERLGSGEKIAAAYRSDWEFILSVLANGIYRR